MAESDEDEEVFTASDEPSKNFNHIQSTQNSRVKISVIFKRGKAQGARKSRSRRSKNIKKTRSVTSFVEATMKLLLCSPPPSSPVKMIIFVVLLAKIDENVGPCRHPGAFFPPLVKKNVYLKTFKSNLAKEK